MAYLFTQTHEQVLTNLASKLDLSALVEGQILTFNKARGLFEATNPKTPSIFDLVGVSIANPLPNQVLSWDAETQKWVAKSIKIEDAPDVLADLDDVATEGVLEGQTLVYRGSGWGVETLSFEETRNNRLMINRVEIVRGEPQSYQMKPSDEYIGLRHPKRVILEKNAASGRIIIIKDELKCSKENPITVQASVTRQTSSVKTGLLSVPGVSAPIEFRPKDLTSNIKLMFQEDPDPKGESEVILNGPSLYVSYRVGSNLGEVLETIYRYMLRGDSLLEPFTKQEHKNLLEYVETPFNFVGEVLFSASEDEGYDTIGMIDNSESPYTLFDGASLTLVADGKGSWFIV
jgi:hypothetical protein